MAVKCRGGNTALVDTERAELLDLVRTPQHYDSLFLFCDRGSFAGPCSDKARTKSKSGLASQPEPLREATVWHKGVYIVLGICALSKAQRQHQ